MVERIAAALKVDPPELFSTRNIPSASVRNLQKTVLKDIEKAVGKIVSERLKEFEYGEETPDTAQDADTILP